MDKMNHEFKCVYIDRYKKYFIIYRDYFDGDEYSILAFDDNELEAYKKAFNKIFDRHSFCLDKISELSNIFSKEFPENLEDCFLSSSYFETCEDNPSHTGDTRTESRTDALYYNEEIKEWGFVFR